MINDDMLILADNSSGKKSIDINGPTQMLN